MEPHNGPSSFEVFVASIQTTLYQIQKVKFCRSILQIFWHFSWVVFIGVLKVLLKNLHQWQQFGNFLRIGWWPVLVSFTTTSKLLCARRPHNYSKRTTQWIEKRRPKQQLTHFFYLAWDRWQIRWGFRAFILGTRLENRILFMLQTMTSKHTDLHPERKITEFKGFFSLKTRIFYVNPALLWIFMARLMGVKLPPKNPILHKSHTVHRTKHIFAFLSSDMIFSFFSLPADLMSAGLFFLNNYECAACPWRVFRVHLDSS